MNYRVVFSPEAEEHLVSLYRYIASAATPDKASRYTEAIVNYCERLRTLPHRGTMRDNVRPGLRITHDKKRAVIAFIVESEQVFILGVFYGGQDYESILQDDGENGHEKSLVENDFSDFSLEQFWNTGSENRGDQGK